MMSTSLPAEFWQGVEQFNSKQFYDCHDTLEALWFEAVEPEKTFYQGILQIAVALYHLGNQNVRGAIILLGEGMNRLRPYCPTFDSIDVEHLVRDSAELQRTLQHLDPGTGIEQSSSGNAQAMQTSLLVPMLHQANTNA